MDCEVLVDYTHKLCGRCGGLLVRIYNYKKMVTDTWGWLGERTVEGAIKHISKKYGSLDIKQSFVSALGPVRTEIIKDVGPLYSTLLDLMGMLDQVREFGRQLGDSRPRMDISTNQYPTASVLQLVADLVSCLLLVSDITNLKHIVVLFFYCHSSVHADRLQDSQFTRLARLLNELDAPFSKIRKEVSFFGQTIRAALISLDKHTRLQPQFESLQWTELKRVPPYVISRWTMLSLLGISAELNEDCLSSLLIQTVRAFPFVCLIRDQVRPSCELFMRCFAAIKLQLPSKITAELKAISQNPATNFLEERRDRRVLLLSLLEGVHRQLSNDVCCELPLISKLLLYAGDEIKLMLSVNVLSGNRKMKFEGDLADRSVFALVHMIGLVQNACLARRSGILHLAAAHCATALCQLQASSCGDEVLRRLEESFAYGDVGDCEYALCLAEGIYSLRGMPVPVALSELSAMNCAVNSYPDWLARACDISAYFFVPELIQQHFSLCISRISRIHYIDGYIRLTEGVGGCFHELCPEEQTPLSTMAESMRDKFLSDVISGLIRYIEEAYSLKLHFTDQVTNPARIGQRLLTHISCKHQKRGVLQSSTNEYSTNMANVMTYITTLANTLRKFGLDKHTSLFESSLHGLLLRLIGESCSDLFSLPSQINMRIGVLTELLVHVDAPLGCALDCLQAGLRLNSTIQQQMSVWYCDFLLQVIARREVIYSFAHDCFVGMCSHDGHVFDLEEYTSYSELDALCQLVGSHGVGLIVERVFAHVVDQFSELMQIASQLQVQVMHIHGSVGDHVLLTESVRALQKNSRRELDVFFNRLIVASLLLQYRAMLHSVVQRVYDHPHLTSDSQLQLYLSDPSTTADCGGLTRPVMIHSLLVLIAACLTRPCTNVKYYEEYDGFSNNVGSISLFIRTFFPALISSSDAGSVDDLMKLFLLISSSVLCDEDDPSLMKMSLSRVIRRTEYLSNDVLEQWFPQLMLL